MASQYDSLLEGIEGPRLGDESPNLNLPTYRETSTPQYDSLLEGISREPKQEGIKAWFWKGVEDMKDYVTITSQTPMAMGAGDFDEELVAESIADITRRSQNIVMSAGHKRMMDMMQQQGKEFSEAEGFVESSKEILEWVGNAVVGMVTDPQGMAEFTAGQLGMQAPGIAGLFAGWVTLGPVGGYLGMGAGEMSVETGAAVFEAMHHRGIDTTDSKAVLDTLFNTDLLDELYKEGMIKGGTIAVFGMAGVGLQKFILTAAGRKLSKNLIKAGITKPLNKGGMADAILAEAGGNTAVKAAFKTFADATTKTRHLGRAAGATTVELLSEGGGEAFGQKFAWGKVDPAEVGLEMLGAFGQSVLQTGVVTGLSGAKQLTNRTMLKRAQRNALEKGEDSGITPEAINEDLQLRVNAVRDRMVDIDTEMVEWERVLSGADSNSSLSVLADEVASLGGIEKYQSTLRTILQEELGTDFVPIWTALTKEEQATLAAGGTLDHAVRGSLNKGLVKPKGTEEVVAVRMPVASVIARGNWDAMELVSSPFGIELVVAPVPAPATTGGPPPPKPVVDKLGQAERILAREDEDVVLERERVIGELEGQAVERSKRDVEADIKTAATKAENKRAQLKEPEDYSTVNDLQKAVDRSNIPLFPGQRRKRPSLALALTNYRKALSTPGSKSAIDSVIAPLGYKLLKTEEGVSIVPIGDGPALSVPQTGNREIGQSTVDDYIAWIKEEQAAEPAPTTEKRRAAIRKEIEKEEALKAPKENVQEAIDSIERNFVTRKDGKVVINEEGLEAFVDEVKEIETWTKADKSRLDKHIKSLRREQELEGIKPRKIPIKGITIVTPQSAGVFSSLQNVFKRTGKGPFIERVRKLLTNKKGNDALLEQIANAHRKAIPGRVEGDVASILALTGKAEQADIARAYALASLLITLQDSVSIILPDNTLSVEDKNTKVLARLELRSTISGVKENLLINQIKEVFGEGTTYTRISDFTVIISNENLSSLQIARRFGRLKAKRNDIRSSGLFTAKTETYTQNWAEDFTGASIRDEIRSLGFGDILEYVDDRRAAYVALAEEFGATESRGARRASARRKEEGPVAASVPLDRIDDGEQAQKEIYSRFGTLSDKDTTEQLKLYDLSPLIANPEILEELLERYGFTVKYFSFHEDKAAGVEFVIPKLKKQGYKQGVLWIYDPRVAHGSFKDEQYTRAWRITHELGHALSERFIEEKYGPSRRYGRLGREMIGQRGKPPKVVDVNLPPLSTLEGQRAVEWEDTAFRVQRMLLAELGLELSDTIFANEYNINISDATYRVITGEFGDPGEYGFLPNDTPVPLGDILAILQNTEDALAKSQGRPVSEGIDLATWRNVSEEELASTLLGATEISDAVYKEFVRTGAVSSAILSSIANKIKEGASLSDEERAIHTAKTAEVEDILAEEVVIITDVAEDIDEAVSYSLASEAEKMYQAGATIKGWKLFVQRKDGTLGPLFINRKLRVPIGDWMPAEAHPTKGFAFRPQWHATKIPVAPHLKQGKVGSQFRVWRQVELRGITPMERPESQGGTWFLANELRVPPVSEEDVAYSLEDDVGPTTGLTKTSRTTWIRTREKGLRVKRKLDVLGRVLTAHYKKVYEDPLTLTKEADFNLAANILSAEIKYQLQQEKTGEGWYGIDVEDAYDITEEIIPTIKDRNLNIIHAFVSAILSNDRLVDVNWRNSTVVIKAYADTGIIPYRDPDTNMQFGYGVMAQQLRMLNNMLQDWGPAPVADWLMSEHTVRELDSVRREYGGMGHQADLLGGANEIYLGAEVIGPKTGIFFLNIMGISELSREARETTNALTIDKWATRTINRIIGRMTDPEHGDWTGELSEVGLIDKPRSPAERALFQRLYVEAGRRNGLVKTRADGTIDYTDSQAVPWFFEQQLFTALGAPSTPLGFSDGARKALNQYNEGRIPRRYRKNAIQQTNERAVREVSALSKATVPIEGAQESLTAPEQPASGGLSALGLRRVLVRRFGKAGIAMLEAEGILKIVESATDLPVGLIKDEDAAMRARGLYHSKTGTAYLVANRLTASTAPKVLLHEVGTHFGLKRMLGSKAYATLILDLVAGKETTFEPWFERVRRNYKGRLNENTDRFAEEVLAHIAEDTSEVTLSIRDGIWRAVRLFLNRYFGLKLPKNLSAKEIGYVIQGSLRLAMRGRPRYMVVGTDEVMLGGRRIFFPDYAPTRTLTDAHRRYAIASAIDRVIPPSEESRLRRNMDGMMKVAERVGKKGYPDIDIHLPVVVVGDAITSRYALFKNTKTGTELVIRMSDHPKTIYDAAGAYPFISFNNGHKIDSVDLSDIDRAVKLLSQGKLEGMNGLEFQFEYGLGDGVQGVSKPSMQKVSYNDYKRILGKRSPSKLDRIQNLETVELTIGPIVDEEGPVFSIAPEGGRTEEQRKYVRRTLGAESNASVGEWVNDARHRWLDKFIAGVVDAYRPVRNLLGEGAERAWQMMHLSENVNSMLMTALNFGKPKAVYKNGKFDWYSVDWEGEGLIDTLKGLNGETNDFMAWMTAIRAKKLMAEGREKNFTEDEIKTGLTLNQGEMADGRSRKLVYAQAMQKMSKYQSAMLDMAVEAGVISKAVREELEVDFYVPFYREFMPDDKTGMRGPTPVHDFVNIKDVIHKLRGSELNTHDVLHNVLMNWTALMSASMKNRAGQAAMDAAVKAGVARIVTDKKEAAQLGFSKGKVRGEKLNRFVYVLKDGERVWYEVNDPLVLNSMVQMAWGGVDGKLIRTLSTFKRWLTLGVTASPFFKIRNMIRDTVHSIAVGKLKYNMFGNAAKGYDALKNDELISAEMMMGGATFHFGFYYDDPASLRMMLDAGISESRILNTPAKIRKGLRPFWKWYADMGNRMENANRASLYMQRKEEVGHLAASFEARDLMNFSSHGRWVAVQWLTSAIPFLNARLVGMEKLVRAGEAGTRARMLTVVSTVVLASILLRMSYEDDEDYEKLPEWQKNTYWAIKIPGTKDFFFLPKPFEIGAIASVGERITENFVRDIGWAGNPTRNYTFQQIGEIISDQLAVDWKPQIAKPVIELWRNKDTFTDRRIENISWQMQNTPRERRVRPYTTELAIRSSWAMGELLDMFHAKDTDIHLSPVQIDHLIKGYFGWLGAFTTSSFDILSSDVEPTKHVTDMLGSFYLRNPKGNDKYLALFYEQALEVAKYKSAYDAYKRDRMVEQALQVVEEHGDVLRWEKAYTKIREGIAKINRRIREIYDDPDMSPTDKDKELDKLRQLRVDIAKKTVLTRAQWEAARGIKPSHGSIPLEAMGGGD